MAFKAIPVVSAKVPASQSNFPAYIQPSVLTGWGALTLAEANSTRFYADSAKTIELAREVVALDEIWVNIASLTNATIIYCDYDGIRADYGVATAFGRNAVWSPSNNIGVFHLNETSGNRTDSSGNDDLADINTVLSATGMVGANAATFSRPSSERLENTTANVSSGDIPLEMAFWHKTSLASTYRVISSLVIASSFGGANRSFFEVQINNTDNKLYSELGNQGGANLATNTTAVVNDGVKHHYVVKIRNLGGVAQMKLYMDGALVMTSTHASLTYSLPANFTSFTLGATRDYATGSYTHYITGDVDESRLRHNLVVDDNYTLTEYNNQSAVASFWGTVTEFVSGSRSNNMLLKVG